MIETKTQLITSGDYQIHVTEAGEGQPLLMLHGGGAGASALSNFGGNLQAFAAHYRVLLPDFVGYGGSTMAKPDGERIAFYAKGIVDIMDALEITGAHILGNSLGGAVAIWIGIHRPELVGRLVLMGPGIAMPTFAPFPTEGWKAMGEMYQGEGPTKAKMRGLLETMVHDKSLITDELVDERFASATDPKLLAAQPGPPSPESPYRFMEKDIEQLNTPSLILWGRDDRVTPYDSVFQFFGRMKQSELHVFSECGHWVQTEQRERFNRVVLDYLAR
ncbi:alpha/beta fold hydrolase [Aurantiacibacter sediminis]|uniref:Alpha/beta fold hydrolase n=1 Tax=Aurantiacibacter sediminis TaxID=2793064 RepID=A0ABS0N6U8_9SPHN|nr:alpha/beta fold hydrolase [Aurantiacibacter sediminis]MBH5323480.1 alpha/beta fold hydrolase [Aurantiacibacter sediminis]